MTLSQNFRTLVSLGRSSSTRQPVTLVEPPLRIVYCPSYPVDQDLVTWNVAVSVVAARAVDPITTATAVTSEPLASSTAVRCLRLGAMVRGNHHCRWLVAISPPYGKRPRNGGDNGISKLPTHLPGAVMSVPVQPAGRANHPFRVVDALPCRPVR